ncbi:uncharacterized protein BJ212DRAFT_1286563, partial [Suillus subaureus]
AHWHRQPDGKLKQGTLQKWRHNCSAKYNIFTPHDLHACPRILIVCRNPHSHPPPAPVKTPPGLVNVVHGLLALMKWKLADATPRQIFLDTTFVEGLHHALAWDLTSCGRDAILQDLHPSLANLDHVQRLITTLQNKKYPSGTGFEGACLLANEHASLPPEQCYVHCAEVHPIEHGKELKLVICMTTKMSQHLLQAKHLSIDTSFKHAQGWQEFEIESWDVDHICLYCGNTYSSHYLAVVGARAFTMSQTAKAHVILFQHIFEIASADTGLPIMFHHIHGTGFETVIADSHKGQGLSLGMYCVQLCCSVTAQCIYEPHHHICDLNPYDHLRCFFHTCVAHYKRNILSLCTHVSQDIFSAMLSLATSEHHPDLNATLNIIWNGGLKASAWLRDKLDGMKFALPAIYQPSSLIPLHLWRASPATTNRNEQAHCNAYREGVHLTLLTGLMKGMRFDQGAMMSINKHTSFGIATHDHEATHIHRAMRCVSRQSLCY